MKLVNYKCSKCGKEVEELYNDSEKIPKTLKTEKCKCGGSFKIWNFKKNDQVWKADL